MIYNMAVHPSFYPMLIQPKGNPTSSQEGLLENHPKGKIWKVFWGSPQVGRWDGILNTQSLTKLGNSCCKCPSTTPACAHLQGWLVGWFQSKYLQMLGLWETMSFVCFLSSSISHSPGQPWWCWDRGLWEALYGLGNWRCVLKILPEWCWWGMLPHTHSPGPKPQVLKGPGKEGPAPLPRVSFEARLTWCPGSRLIDLAESSWTPTLQMVLSPPGPRLWGENLFPLGTPALSRC